MIYFTNNKTDSDTGSVDSSDNMPVNTPLHETVYDCVSHFLESMGDQSVNNLYDLCISQVEPSLIKAAMEHCNYNQTQASKLLGINRGTLRKKCLQYDIQEKK